MCLQSRSINHTRGSHPPKTDMLVRYTMYFEHLNIMFFQKKNFAVKIMIKILRIYDINMIIMMMMRGLADPTRTIYYHYQHHHHHHRHYYYYIIIATIVI